MQVMMRLSSVGVLNIQYELKEQKLGMVASCCKPSSGAGVVRMNSRHRKLVWLPKP